MATYSTDVLFDTSINLTDVPSVSTPRITVTDDSDIVALGIDVGDLRGLIKVTNPDGVDIYDNTDTNSPDITTDGGSKELNLSSFRDADNKWINGKYKITLTVFDVDVPATQYDRIYQFELNYARPIADVDVDWSIVNPVYFTAVDNTAYKVQNVDPTITRDFRRYNPASVGGYDSSSTKTLTTVNFYDQENEVTLESVLSYTIGVTGIDGFTNSTGATVSVDYDYTLLDKVYFNDSYDVVQASAACDLQCCLEKLQSRVQSLKTKGGFAYEEAKEAYEQGLALAIMAQRSFECNRSEKAAYYISQFREVTQCTDDCGCTDGEPQQVVGIGTLPNRIRKLRVVTTEDITSYTWTELKNLSYDDGDFEVTQDGRDVDSMLVNTTFDSSTGEFGFGYTVTGGSVIVIRIIKP